MLTVRALAAFSVGTLRRALEAAKRLERFCADFANVQWQNPPTTVVGRMLRLAQANGPTAAEGVRKGRICVGPLARQSCSLRVVL